MKKNISIIRESIRSRIAAKRALRIFLNDLIDEIVLNGLSTLKDLSPVKFTEL